MNVFIILHKLTQSEISQLIDEFNPKKDLIFADNRNYITNVSLTKNVSVIDIKKVQMIDAQKECHDGVVMFGHELINNKKITDWLSFNNKTYWYYTRYKLFNSSKDHFFKKYIIHHILSELIQNRVFEKVVFYYSSDTFKHLLKPELIAKSKFYLRKTKYTKQILGVIKYSTIFLIRALIGLFQLPLIFYKEHVILDKQIKKQQMFKLSDGSFQLGNPSTEYLLEKAYSDNSFLFLTEMRSPKLTEIHEMKFAGSVWEPKFFRRIVHFETFLFFQLFSLFGFLELNKFSNHLKKVDQSLSNYIKTGLNKVYFEVLKSTYKTMLLSFFREKAANIFFNLSSPKTFGGAYEQSAENIPLFESAKSNKIKTYGIQHGTISPLSISYMFNEQSKEHQPWPNVTMVRGTSFMNLLNSYSSYPKEKVISVGQLRTDCIPALMGLKKIEVLDNLKDERPIVLYISQVLPTSEKIINERLIDDFFKLTKQYSNYQFILKPHPTEKNFGIYSNMAKKYGSDNFQLYQGDLYKILAISDAVLVFHSTVGGEAVFFNKQVIVLDYFNNDRVGYIKDGVAHKAVNYDSLKQILKDVIEGKIKTDQEKLTRFISERAHKIDGKTTDRFYSYIKSL